MSDYENEEETKVVYKNNFFGTLITLIIGLILGIVLTVGGVVGAGYWAITQPINSTVNKVDELAGTDVYAMLFGSEDGAEGILSESYASKTVKQLFKDVGDAVSGLTADGGSLSALDNISPQVGVALEKLASSLDKYAISLDAATLLTKPLKSSNESVETLTEYLTSSIQNTAIGDLFSAFSKETLSDLMMVLCYGEKGVDYVVGENGEVQMLGDSKKTTLNDLLSGDMMKLLGSVPVDAVLEVSLNDDVMCAIAYGSSDRVYLGEDGKAKMNQVVYTLDGSLFRDDKGNQVIGIYEEIDDANVKLTLSTGETDGDGNPITQTQYVSLQDGKWLAFTDAELTTPLLYEKVKIGDLQGDAMAIIDNVYLKDALGVKDNTQHKVLISLAYGQEGTDYSIDENGVIQPINNPRTIGELRLRGGNLINEIALSDIMGEDREQPIVMYLLYGREYVHYKIDANNVVQMLQRRIAVLDGKAYNEYGELMGGTLNPSEKTYADANGVSYTYGDTAIDTLKIGSQNAPVYYLFNADGSEAKYTRTSLGDMAGSDNLISRISTRLTIGEIMEIDENGDSLLKHVKNETIDSLPTAIENLTIKQVFEKDIYKKDSNGDFVLDSNNQKVLEGSWWYLLHNEASCKANGHTDSSCSCSNDYTLQEMDALIDNMKNNIHLSTLQKLSDDGMLNFGDGMLNSEIIKQVNIGSGLPPIIVYVRVPDENGNFPAEATTPAAEAFAGKQKLGELTVEETIEYAEGLIKVIEQIDQS